MAEPDDERLDELIRRIEGGDEPAKAELSEIVYDKFRKMARARGATPGHTLQPTAMANEAWLRLRKSGLLDKPKNRQYFFGAAAVAMQRILVEYLRQKRGATRGGKWQRVPLEQALAEHIEFAEGKFREVNGFSILDLEEPLRELKSQHPDWHYVLHQHIYLGREQKEIAGDLGIGPSTVTDYKKRGLEFLANKLDRGNRKKPESGG